MGDLLVFADDGSSCAGEAWAWVAAQCWPGWTAEILVADVHPAHQKAGHLLGTHRTEAPEAGFVSVARRWEPRRPDEILPWRGDASVIVVGPRGRGEADSKLGSTAAVLVHRPPVPVVVARGPARVEWVVVAADGSIHSRAAAEAFTSMPWARQTEVLVLGVDDGHVSRRDLCHGQRETMTLLEAAGIGGRYLRLGGQAIRRTLEEAGRLGAGLVVVGSRGPGIRRASPGGSVALAVAGQSRSSVLVASAPPGGQRSRPRVT